MGDVQDVMGDVQDDVIQIQFKQLLIILQWGHFVVVLAGS